MRVILIPVKDLTRAKQRLAGLLTQVERTQLAWAMMEQIFAAAGSVINADRIAVVTLYPPAMAMAERFGFTVIQESEQISESAAVDFGSRACVALGAEAVLRLPIDLPLITTSDIEMILNHDCTEPSVVIVPSRDGTGTNAILRRPPTLFPSHFGPGSLAKHLAAAEKAKARCTVLELPHIALDIDEPDDLAELLRRGSGSPLTELLAELRVSERLTPPSSTS